MGSLSEFNTGLPCWRTAPPLPRMESAMPKFSNALPDKTENRGYDLRRTPPDAPLKGLITSDDLIGCFTHWWGGRTVPCEDENCEACRANTPTRWHCYLSVLQSGSHDHFIFECTGKAALPLIDWRDENGTLRGALMTAFRPKRRRNARVEIILKPYDISQLKFPKAPDLIRAMSVIWQLPETALETPHAENTVPKIQVDPVIIAKQRGELPKTNNKPRSRKKVPK